MQNFQKINSLAKLDENINLGPHSRKSLVLKRRCFSFKKFCFAQSWTKVNLTSLTLNFTRQTSDTVGYICLEISGIQGTHDMIEVITVKYFKPIMHKMF